MGSEAVNSPTLASYVNYMTMFTLPSGIVFELPVIVYFLTKIGLVGSAAMKKYRRHAIVVILILAAIITPPGLECGYTEARPSWRPWVFQSPGRC